MSQNRSSNPRLIAIALLAGLILLALVIATGGGFSSPASSPPPPPAAPVAQAPTVPAGGHMRGTVTPSVHHLNGRTWQFQYTVRNTGTVPIAGFEINAPRSNLFHITGEGGWGYYGEGVCAGHYPGVLIYWSTGVTGPSLIEPKGTGHFGFDVNMTGSASASYSLSWTSFAIFGTTQAPAGSSLAASGPCR